MTDEQLAAEMREAAAVVITRVDELAAGGAWPIAVHDKAIHATLRTAQHSWPRCHQTPQRSMYGPQ